MLGTEQAAVREAFSVAARNVSLSEVRESEDTDAAGGEY